MKIGLISDTHYGVRGDNIAFIDNSKKFMDNVFFPVLKKENIDTIIHLGDLVDRRKYINFNTAKRLREDFIDPIVKNNYNFHIIAGNHDVYFKNTNTINSLRELIGNHDNIRIYDNVSTEIEFDGLKFLLVPWICEDNQEYTFNGIKNSNAQILIGHLELEGFEMFKGSSASHGYDRKLFEHFDLVLSGHYHHRSTDGHIYYLGSHAEFTWADYKDPRGFHIFDTETRDLKFIENPYNMFKIINYNDSENDNILEDDLTEYKECIVKVVIEEKNNNYIFEKFIENLERKNPAEIIVVDKNLALNMQDLDDDVIKEAENIVDVFKNYINTRIDDSTINKPKLLDKMIELHKEAIIQNDNI